ncbi:MAG: hypothetical protein E7499_06425 [Ruminococcus sp.]|nr:hypothetical protein [Ruminococcus sp.]
MKNIDGASELTIRKRKKIDTKPFDRYRIPPKQNFFLMPIIWLLCFLSTRSGRLKIKKVNMKGLKPPFIVFGTHHAFMDFFVTPLALFPYRANYVSELEGFEYYGEWIYRQIGCLGTRKFVNDIALVKNIKKVLDRKGIAVIYPEARYANVGTNTCIPVSVGKMAKKYKVPVVAINMHGNYLQSPIWNLKKRKGVPLEAEIVQLFSREELENTDAEAITQKLSQYLTYDEYKWQADNKIAIDCDFRAEGLHKALYRCESCQTDFSMNSKGTKIFCEKCGAEYHMNEYGRLIKNGNEFRFSHIPDWYEWQRECVHNEIDSGKYLLDIEVQIEALPNAVNFISCGTGRLRHNDKGFSLRFKEYGETEEKELKMPPLSAMSVHTEYDYRGKGQCITLSTLDNTYFLFPREAGFNSTKIQFATEYLYKKSSAKPIKNY